jgi:hypothetical protein
MQIAWRIFSTTIVSSQRFVRINQASSSASMLLWEGKKETCTVSRYCDICSYTDKYLHLPAMVGMDRSDCFQFLVARVCKRINSWMETILSAGGTELLPMRQHKLYQHMWCRYLRFQHKLANHGCGASVLVRRWCISKKDALVSLLENLYPEERKNGVWLYSLF